MLRVRKHREESPGPSSPPLEAGEEEEDEEEVSTDDEDCFAGDRAGNTPPRSAAAPRGRRRKHGGKRPRLSWTPEMHADFLTAVAKLGGPWTATPKAILECMAHPEHLTLTNIKSKIQKHRLRSSREARADQQRATAAQAGLLAALGGGGLGGSAASLAGGGGQLGNSGPLKGCDSRGPALACVDTVCQPGMVPVATVSPGPVAALPSLLCNTLAPRGPPTGVSTDQLTAATAALAAGRQQPELPFEDGTLGAQAAACRRRQQQALGAMAATLQQAQRQQAAACSGGVCCAAGPGHPALQAVPARLLRLQLDNAQCVKQLHGLHMLQMQRHLEGAARLKALAAGQGLRWSEADRMGPAGGSGADAVREGALQKQEPSQQQTGHAAGGKQDKQGPAREPARQAAALPPRAPMVPTLTALEVMTLSRVQPASHQAGEGGTSDPGLDQLQGSRPYGGASLACCAVR